MVQRALGDHRMGGSGAGLLARGALPNLLIIGAAKCGTTSLHNYLDLHPDIAMSATKELNFFLADGTWSNGVEWYRAQFDPGARVRGESSTNYTARRRSDRVAERARDVLDDARLIYLVRDPLERIRSHYHHNHASGRERRTMSEALADPENQYVRASSYATQLEPFIESFGRDRVLVETQERLLSDRRACLKRVFRFLEVDAGVELHGLEKVWERSEGKGWGYRVAWALAQRGVRVPRSLRWPAQRLLRSRLLGGGGWDAGRPLIEGRLREAVAPRLAPEADALRRMTGMEFAEWSL